MNIYNFKYFDIQHIRFRERQLFLKYDELLQNSERNQDTIETKRFKNNVKKIIEYMDKIKSKLIYQEDIYNPCLFGCSILDSVADYYDYSMIYDYIKIVEDALGAVIDNQRNTSLINNNINSAKFFREDVKHLPEILLTDVIYRDNIAFYFSTTGQSSINRLSLLVIKNQDILSKFLKKLQIMDISSLTEVIINNEYLEKNIYQLNAENALMLNHFIEVYEHEFYLKAKEYYYKHINQNRMKYALEGLYNQFDDYYQKEFLISDTKNSNMSGKFKPVKKLFNPFITKFDYKNAPYVEVEKRKEGSKDSNLEHCNYFYHDKEEHRFRFWDFDGRDFFRSIESLQNYYILENMYYMRKNIFNSWFSGNKYDIPCDTECLSSLNLLNEADSERCKTSEAGGVEPKKDEKAKSSKFEPLSDSYDEIKYNGKVYESLTKKQAELIKFLDNMKEPHSDKKIQQETGIRGRIDHIFVTKTRKYYKETKELWGTLIKRDSQNLLCLDK